MLTFTKIVLFVNKDNNTTRRFISSYKGGDKDVRIFIAKTNGFGYGFVVTKVKKHII